MPHFLEAVDAGATLGRSARFFARPSASIVPTTWSVIVDHVAIVVADLEQALQLYTQTLGFRQVYRETIATKASRPSDSRPANPSWNSCVRWRRTRHRSLPRDAPTKLHHTAYRVDDVAASWPNSRPGASV